MARNALIQAAERMDDVVRGVRARHFGNRHGDHDPKARLIHPDLSPSEIWARRFATDGFGPLADMPPAGKTLPMPTPPGIMRDFGPWVHSTQKGGTPIWPGAHEVEYRLRPEAARPRSPLVSEVAPMATDLLGARLRKPFEPEPKKRRSLLGRMFGKKR